MRLQRGWRGVRWGQVEEGEGGVDRGAMVMEGTEG